MTEVTLRRARPDEAATLSGLGRIMWQSGSAGARGLTELWLGGQGGQGAGRLVVGDHLQPPDVP
jgi:hypothetical protein